MALSFSPAEQGQGELLFGIVPANAKSELRSSLMATMDKVNDKYGRGSLHMAGTEKFATAKP